MVFGPIYGTVERTEGNDGNPRFQSALNAILRTTDWIAEARTKKKVADLQNLISQFPQLSVSLIFLLFFDEKTRL